MSDTRRLAPTDLYPAAPTRSKGSGDRSESERSPARTRGPGAPAQFWRLARRIGKKKAAVAVAHSILVICWHLVSDDCDYDDLGGDYFTRRNTDRQRGLINQLHNLGYRVTLDRPA